MSILLASIQMHDVPRKQDPTDSCSFRQGDIGKSSYTKIECELRRQKAVEDGFNVAYPDINYDTYSNVPIAYTAFYQARFTQEATSGSNISVISPDELIRFYQAYNIAKDLQYREPVTRRLSVSLEVVQLSVIFLTIAMLVGLLILLGLIRYGLFAILHWRIMISTPQSKLDWMIQSIQTEDHPLSDTARRIGKNVMASQAARLSGFLSIGAKKREFETAMYCERGAIAWPVTESAAVTDQVTSPMLNHAYGGRSFQCVTEVVENDKKVVPDLTISRIESDTRAR